MINLLRNREIRTFLYVMAGITLITSVLAIFSFISPVWHVFLTCCLLISCFLVLTKSRYKEIERLSSYLRKISSGDDVLDIRDNREGELSILKNNIYKVTLMLSEQRALLQEDKMQLTDAISDISHQLKTPLTSMMVMTDLLSDAQLPSEKRAEFTHNISVQLERIEWLVSSLLKLSKIDAGTALFKTDVTYVKAVIQKAIEPVLIPIDIKELTVSTVGDDDVTFIGDLNWTVEAILNILKNCVEHTKKGGVITISYSENVLYTEIIIADNGKGIPKEDIPYIFKRFYKGKNANEDSVGIGLAMAHSIIKRQNGDINVESSREKGTRFHIKLYKQVI